jgi:glycosyltransferase involved in cell wall biosynthesis
LERSLPIALPELGPEPLVSVLIANYNYARFLGHALESVLRQTYRCIEIIVCDDGSSDDSCSVVESYAAQDARVRLVRLPHNRGMAGATNAAYAASSGEIICLLDADDSFAPGKIGKLVQHFRSHPRAGLVLHPLTVTDAVGRPIQQIPYLTRFERGWVAPRVIARGGRWRDMPTSALCLRREAAALAFPIPEPQFRRAADGFIFTLLPLLTEVSAIDEPLAHYRIHGANDLAARGLSVESIRSRQAFLEQQNSAVNQRLGELTGRPDLLQLDRHVVYQQTAMQLSLQLGAPRVDLVRQLTHLLRQLVRDDLYSRKQKALGAMVYGMAIVLPLRARPWWLGNCLGLSPAKRRVQTAVRHLSAGARWLGRGPRAADRQ